MDDLKHLFNKFCLIGNSHTSQFDESEKLDILYGYGASIGGLLNENSYLRLKDTILNYQKENPNKIFIFFLGQTDIEFIYYFKSVKQNKKLEKISYINDLIQNYIYFIKNYITNDCVILGINPHVIDDIKHIFNVNFRANCENDPNGKNNLTINFEDYLHIYNDSYEERFNFNKYFNDKLKVECKNNNIKYCDMNKYILDENNRVKTEYLPKYTDHHIAKNKNLFYYLLVEINKILQ
jgi:hypothetical protein